MQTIATDKYVVWWWAHRWKWCQKVRNLWDFWGVIESETPTGNANSYMASKSNPPGEEMAHGLHAVQILFAWLNQNAANLPTWNQSKDREVFSSLAKHKRLLLQKMSYWPNIVHGRQSTANTEYNYHWHFQHSTRKGPNRNSWIIETSSGCSQNKGSRHWQNRVLSHNMNLQQEFSYLGTILGL